MFETIINAINTFLYSKSKTWTKIKRMSFAGAPHIT